QQGPRVPSSATLLAEIKCPQPGARSHAGSLLAGGASAQEVELSNGQSLQLRRHLKFRVGPEDPRAAAHCLEVEMTESNNRQDPVRHYIKRDTAQARAYSQAVVTNGGRIVWLAGQVGAADASGKSLAGDFDGQVREVFSRLGQTLGQAGGALADMVTMTVFI